MKNAEYHTCAYIDSYNLPFASYPIGPLDKPLLILTHILNI